MLKDEGTNGTLAYVTHGAVGGVTNKLSLTVNMGYFNNMDESDPNGSSPSTGSQYLDRVIAHELTHAVMAANVKDMNNLPLFIVEGFAEVTHGIDDNRILRYFYIFVSEKLKRVL